MFKFCTFMPNVHFLRELYIINSELNFLNYFHFKNCPFSHFRFFGEKKKHKSAKKINILLQKSKFKLQFIL